MALHTSFHLDLIYPTSDGMPIAESTLQFRWITTVEGNMEALFVSDPNVFVAGDLLWYPVEGHPEIRQAPDILLAFGPPKGDRGSYLQWVEGNIAPQVVWEILPPGHTCREMLRLLEFYDRYGVEEFVVFDPETQNLLVYQRVGGQLRQVEDPRNWVSPRTEVRFDFSGKEMRVVGPDGYPFLTYSESTRLTQQIRQETERVQRQTEAIQRQTEAIQRQVEQTQRQTEEKKALTAQLRALRIEPEA